ncbi:MAG: hypothetical protein H0X17_06660 [Deltaproteobacteria bacterium]|nr:hypothetical protein [Deltaproteobacteria bacterium]
MASDDDKTVKQLIDAATRAELEKWFGLPSFDQVEEQRAREAPVEDPEIAAVRERRDRAIAAVDPGLLEAHRLRVEGCDTLIKFKSTIDVHVDPSVALLDLAMIDRQASIAEPREVEISDELREDLRDCTPQALLRDLHRPELDFDKVFEIVDYAAEQRLDAVAAVAEVMTTRWKISTISTSSWAEGREILRALRIERHQPMTDALASLPNRRPERSPR